MPTPKIHGSMSTATVSSVSLPTLILASVEICKGARYGGYDFVELIGTGCHWARKTEINIISPVPGTFRKL